MSLASIHKQRNYCLKIRFYRTLKNCFWVKRVLINHFQLSNARKIIIWQVSYQYYSQYIPQQYQNFQRLLQWLGLQVHVVAHADAQRELWKTGLYCVLFTEFSETSLLEMVSKPLVTVGVFSLTDDVPNSESNHYFDDWHIGQLVEQSTLAELSEVLAPWLQTCHASDKTQTSVLAPTEELIVSLEVNNDENDHVDKGEGQSDAKDEGVITELVTFHHEGHKEAAFDFSKYLHHQGSVELALFMLDEYTQDNHLQLDILIEAIKATNFDKAKEAITDLQLNAKILVATELEQLCSQWSKLLNGKDIPSSLLEVNILLKKTRTALTAIDRCAESI